MIGKEKILRRFKAMIGFGDTGDWSHNDNLTMEEQEEAMTKIKFLSKAFDQKMKELGASSTSVSWEEIESIAEELYNKSVVKDVE